MSGAAATRAMWRQINLRSDREATVTFCFEKSSSGESVTLDSFSFVFHDFDNGDTLRERLRVGRPGAQHSTREASGSTPAEPSLPQPSPGLLHAEPLLASE